MERGAALAEAANAFEQERSVPQPAAPVAAPAGPMAGLAPRGASLSPAAVLALQRSAGNASVARLISDALPAGIVDSLTGVQKTVADAESSAVGGAENRIGAAETTLRDAPRELEGGLAAVDEPHAQAAATHGEQADASAAKVQQDASALQEEGKQAGEQVKAVAPQAPSLLSPAKAIAEPSAAAAVAGRLDSLGAAVAGESAGLDAAGQVQGALGAGAQPEWNVDLAEVVGAAGGMRTPQVGGAVPLAERKSGEERLGQVTAFAGQLGGRVDQLAGGLGSGLAGLGAKARERLTQKADGVTGLADHAAGAVSDGFAALKRGLLDDVDKAKEQRVAGADTEASQAKEGIAAVLGQAKGRLSGAAQTAERLLGGLGSTVSSLLPASLSGLGSGIADAQGRVDARQADLFPRLADIAKRAKAGIISAARSFADAKLREYVMRERIFSMAIEGAKRIAQGVGRVVSAIVPDEVKKLGADLEKAAAGEMARLQAAADAIVGKLKGGACVALEHAGAPYVRQYLPDLNNGINNTVRITASADLIVPLEEFAIPANLKVAAGASVEVGVQDGVYTVKVNGEAALLANETFGKEAHATVTDTGSAPTQTEQAFAKLGGGGGGGAAPAVAAKVGGAVATAGDAATNAGDAGSPGGTRSEINAGLKGSVNAEWRFDAVSAQTSCDGIGGMLTLLGGLGASAALPAPFNQLAGGAVFKSFMPNLEKCRFSVGGTVEADGDLKTGGIADFKGRLGAEAMENFEVARKDGKLVSQRTRTIQADLDATAVAGLASGSFAKYRAFLGIEGIARLTMVYEKGTDEVLPTSLGGAVALSFGAKNFEPSLIPEQFGTEVPEIRRILTGSFPGIDGPREVKVTLTIGRVYEHLEPLGRELKAYLARPLDTITVDGVVEIVRRHLATLPPTDHVKLTISQTQRKEIDLGAVEGEAAALGGDVDVRAEHTLSKTWVSYSGSDEVVDLAAGRARVAPQVIEPDDKKKKDKKGKPRFPTGMTEDDPIPMIWAKPLRKYKNPINLVDGKTEKLYFRNQVQKLNGRDIGVPGFFGEAGVPFRRGAFSNGRGVENDFKRHLEQADFQDDGADGWITHAPDHVFDLAYGGADAFSNLWPLDKATNGNASSAHGAGQLVTFSKPDDGPDDPPRVTTLSRTDPRAPKGKGVPEGAFDRGHENIYFRITRTDTTA